MIEVKSGVATLTQLNHFIQTISNRKGNVGVFVCFAAEVIKGMTEAAKQQGYYRENHFGATYDRIHQINAKHLRSAAPKKQLVPMLRERAGEGLAG